MEGSQRSSPWGSQEVWEGRGEYGGSQGSTVLKCFVMSQLPVVCGDVVCVVELQPGTGTLEGFRSTRS